MDLGPRFVARRNSACDISHFLVSSRFTPSGITRHKTSSNVMVCALLETLSWPTVTFEHLSPSKLIERQDLELCGTGPEACA